MTKPTNLAAWGATATIVEPSAGVKSAGWAPEQKPPAQWLNWWMKSVAAWMVWLDAFESTAHNWSAAQTFTRGIAANAHAATSSVGIATTSDGAFAGLFVQGASTAGPGGIVWIGGGSGSDASVGLQFTLDAGAYTNALAFRVYRESSPGVIDTAAAYLIAKIYGAFEVTKAFTVGGALAVSGAITGVAATFSGLVTASAGIVSNTVGAVVGLYSVGAAAVPGTRAIASTAANGQGSSAEIQATSPTTARAQVIFKQAGSPTVPDNTYDGVLTDDYGRTQLRGPNPPSNESLPNQVAPTTLLKAWAVFQLHTAASGSVTPLDGMNVGTITFDSATGVITIPFANAGYPMETAYYPWSMTCDGDPGPSIGTLALFPKRANHHADKLEVCLQGASGPLTAALDASIWTVMVGGRQPQI
jgi:hypothetical protein